MDIGKFNLIASSCGTGKSYFVEKHLLEQMPDVLPNEVIFLTSRTIIVEQHTSGEHEEYMDKFDPHDLEIIRGWNGENVPPPLEDNGKIHIMTYDKLIYILLQCNHPDTETLKKIKIFVFDECHTLFSDTFMYNLNVIKVWIRDCLYMREKYFLGMTATPSILFHNQTQWGVKVHQLNRDILVNYKVQNLILTNFGYIPTLLKDRLPAKTIVMCYSINDCYDLQKQVPNSAVLISKSNKRYEYKSMDYIRDYIIENNSLPDKARVNGKEVSVDVLITTSTLREGINLNEASGIKNVICCIPDELHISQFVGRCRFNVENLIIANRNIKFSARSNMYITECHEEFKNFVEDRSNDRWLKSIEHLLENPQAKHEYCYFDKESFFEYVNKEWSNLEIIKYEDRNRILEVAKDCNVFRNHLNKPSFNGVIRILESSGRYKIKSGRRVINGKKVTYKIIQPVEYG